MGDLATARALFEQLCFDYYLGLKAGGWSNSDEGDPTPAALFWRSETQPEMYGVHQIQAAWWGFQMCWAALKPTVLTGELKGKQ